MKIVSVRRSAVVRPKPASARSVEDAFDRALKAPSWAPSKLVEAIEAITTAAEPGSVAQLVAAASGRRRPSLPSSTPKQPSWENIPK